MISREEHDRLSRMTVPEILALEKRVEELGRRLAEAESEKNTIHHEKCQRIDELYDVISTIYSLRGEDAEIADLCNEVLEQANRYVPE